MAAFAPLALRRAAFAPAGLTFEQFRTLMWTGVNPRRPAGGILQVMPWPVYGEMTSRDLRAIYTFLSAIPSLPSPPRPPCPPPA